MHQLLSREGNRVAEGVVGWRLRSGKNIAQVEPIVDGDQDRGGLLSSDGRRRAVFVLSVGLLR